MSNNEKDKEIRRLRKMCNPTKLKIYDEIKKNPPSLSHLCEKISIEYKNALRHVNELQKLGIIKVVRNKFNVQDLLKISIKK